MPEPGRHAGAEAAQSTGPGAAQPAHETGDDEERHEKAPAPRINWTKIGAFVIAALIAFALLWIASEMHYQNCTEEVGIRTRGDDDNLTRLVRNQALDRCDRVPF